MKILLLLMLIFFVGCTDENKSNNEDVDQYEVDTQTKFAAEYVDEQLKSSSNKVARTAGHANIASVAVNVYEKMQQNEEKRENEEFKRHVDKAIRTATFEQAILPYLKKEILFKEIVFETNSDQGYLGADKRLLLGYQFPSLNEEAVFSQVEFEKMLQTIMMFTGFSGNAREYVCKPTPIEISLTISLICHPSESKFVVIYKNGYYTWFEDKKNMFAPIINQLGN